METYGRELVLAEMAALIGHSERMLRDAFRGLPDGTWSWEAKIDRDPGTDSDEPLWVVLDLTIEGDGATLDFSRSSPQAVGAINGPKAVLGSAAIAALKAVWAEVPMNQGVFHAVEFVAPPGLIISAEYPAPICGMAGTCFPAIIDCVLGCLIQVVPERSMAGMCGLSNIVFGGRDSRPGKGADYVCYVWLEGGWGGRVAKRDNHTAMTLFGSSATNQPMEMQERVFPMRFTAYRYERDSAGAGLHRGGFGVTKEWLVTHGDAVLSDIGDRETRGSWGWDGGTDSRPNSFLYAPGTDEEERVGMFRTGMMVREGRRLQYHHAGGGGYGRPHERDPEWVLDDVRDELVSVEAAREVYRVAVRGGRVAPVRLRAGRGGDAGAAGRRRGAARLRDGPPARRATGRAAGGRRRSASVSYDRPRTGRCRIVRRREVPMAVDYRSRLESGVTLPFSWFADPQVFADEQARIFGRYWQYVGVTHSVAEPGPVLHREGRPGAGRDRARPRRLAERLRQHLPAPRDAGGRGLRQARDAPVPVPRLDVRAGRPVAQRAAGRPRARLRRVEARAEAGRRGDLGAAGLRQPGPRRAAARGVPRIACRRSCGTPVSIRRRMAYHGREEAEIAANWKAVVENYLECYHCSTSHPGFSKVIDVDHGSYALTLRSLAVEPDRPRPRERSARGAEYHPTGAVTREPVPLRVADVHLQRAAGPDQLRRRSRSCRSPPAGR